MAGFKSYQILSKMAKTTSVRFIMEHCVAIAAGDVFCWRRAELSWGLHLMPHVTGIGPIMSSPDTLLCSDDTQVRMPHYERQ